VQDLVQAVEARLSDSFSCRQADLPEKMKMVVEAVVTPPPEQPESCSAPPVHRVRAARPTRASLLSFEVGLAEVAHRESVPLLAYSPLAFGMLSGKYAGGARPAGARLTRWDRFSRYSNPEAQAATEAYVALAREHGLQPAQMALAYVNSRPFLGANIIGATTLEQLETNLASEALELPETVLAGIEAIHQRQPNPAP
jgi:aryl-alcohol dehydrogenase-like predicted oxidoreductase